VFREHSTGGGHFRPKRINRRVAGPASGHKMLKFSLAVLFVMTMGTLTIAASAMPVPPDAARPVSQIELAALN